MMRNLVKIQQLTIPAESAEVPDAPVTASTWDVTSDTLICAFGPSEGEGIVELCRLTTSGKSTAITSWEAEVGESTDHILSTHYLADSSSLCVIFASGVIVLVREEPSVEVEMVGLIENGISAAEWSPDEEVLALTTKANALLLMTRGFEAIAEVSFSPEDFKASRHVSVGWGKAETQFEGKHAKAMRDPTVPEKVDRGDLSPQDDGRTAITWRGDGAFLAITSVEKGERRVVRVFSREGTLDSVSEPVDGLESPLSWRPAGNLIASVQRLADRVDIVFFERNGLRHGQFTLKTGEKAPSAELQVNAIWWNGDSTVLAVSLADRVQLWCMGNYHWYLKQEIKFSHSNNKIAIVGHPEKPLKYAFLQDSLVNFTTLVWKTVTGSFIPPNDHGIVGVIDGGLLMITPLGTANVPPPMSFCDVELESTPVDVAISPSGTRIAVLQHDGVDLVSWAFRPLKTPEVKHKIGRASAGESFRQIRFVDEETMCLLGEDKSRSSVLRRLSFNSSQNVEDDEKYPLRAVGLTLQAAIGTGDVFYGQDGGSVVRYSFKENDQQPFCTFPAACPWMESAVFAEQIVVFGLSEGGRLYANDRLLASSVTSFGVTDAHLVFTTSLRVIKFVHLRGSSIYDLEVPTEETSGDERCRNIERGSRLVTVMPSSSSLVLQMPRGNLETIYPRALVLAGARRSIEARNYKKAFLTCRNHRVDLNLLYDYAPAQFLRFIELFIQQLQKIEHIDLFLSQLRDEDVTKTMYRETLVREGAVPLDAPQSLTKVAEGIKVNRICSAVIDILSKKYMQKHMQNIITAYVCKTPPDHESALYLIATLKDKDLCEEAITHICFLSDVNKLYDTALGIYNLEIALMVAQQAQKDPREYLPFLQSLQEMDELRRRYTIDDKLGRSSKALKSLYDTGETAFEEAKRYTIQKELYREALNLYKYERAHLEAIMRDYASYLYSVDRFREAGFAYEFLDERSLAIECYRKVGLWQECLFIATRTPKQEDIAALALLVAEGLYENKDYRSAATVHLDYLEDVEEGLRLLCKGNYFSEAMRTAALKGRSKLLETIIDPSLTETFGSISEMLAECKAQLVAQTARIMELREKNLRDPLAYLDGTTEADAPDNVSLAPTNATTSASLFTRYTGHTLGTALTGETRKTAKNRRKEERKRARGKKGSIYEEEYLMNSVRRLIERVEASRVDVGALVEAMLRRNMRDNAAAVQEQLRELLAQLEGCVESIFVVQQPQQSQQQSPYLPREEYGEGMMQQQQQQPREATPVIKPFEGLSLL